MKKVYLKDLQPDEVIRRLKAGEVAKVEDSEYVFKFIDGMLCGGFLLTIFFYHCIK